LAWAMKDVCSILNTGPFLVTSIGDFLSPIWFPPLIFIIAGVVAFSTGTSWGTMAILIPTAAPLAFQLDGGVYGMTTIISMAAILDGAIFGDHCSPISDTTLMSSIASSCDHIHHVRTQLPYSLLVAFFCLAAGYLPATLGCPPWLSLLMGVVGLLLVVRFIGQKVPEPAVT